MGELIRLALENFTVTLFVLGTVAGLVLAALRRDRPRALPEGLLATFLIFSVGVSYLYNFVMHVFFGDMAARFIGWADSPFQAEVGFASLGFAAGGFIAAFAGRGARAVALIGPALFVLGAAGGHIDQMLVADDFAPGNAGAVFWTDVLFAVVAAALMLWRYRGERA